MTKINEDVLIVTSGINGGSSTQAILPEDFQCFDIGIDGNVRVLYGEDQRTFPVITLHESPEYILKAYESTMRAKDYVLESMKSEGGI